ncbi:MAG: hypothetical protein P8Q91_04245 [Porticoccaceae bacterium]|jgi:hypothetical protein|nr:hypothetical protein [Porticoccaceae bacterium]
MTDTSGGELFTRDGSAGQVAVDRDGNLATGEAPEVVFVPVLEAPERIPFAALAGDSAHLAAADPKPARPPYEGSFSSRIAKVKRQTADNSKQIKKLNFADQKDLADLL